MGRSARRFLRNESARLRQQVHHACSQPHRSVAPSVPPGGDQRRKQCVFLFNDSCSISFSTFGDSAHKHKRKGGHSLSRKEARKQARDTRKQRKAQYFSSPPSNKIRNHGKRPAEADHADSPQRKKAKLENIQKPVVHPTPNSTAQNSRKERPKTSNTKVSKMKTPLEKLAERTTGLKLPERAAKSGLDAVLRTPQEEEEDAYVSYLECKLGWVKGGKRTVRYGKGEDEDGLDGKHVNTLAFCLRIPSLELQISSMAWMNSSPLCQRLR